MTGYLLDVNMLIALTWPKHIHHETAHRWFKRNHTAGWATCPVTQLGFVRISSNPKIIADAVSPREAVAMLERLVKLPHHEFWADDIAVGGDGPFSSLALIGHRQVTDAYLLSLAQHHHGKLATLDQGIAELVCNDVDRAQCLEQVNVENRM